MRRRIDAGRHDPLQDVLRLLDLHHRGFLPAIVSSAAREEQDLALLSRKDLDTILSLLDLPADTSAQTAAVQAIGPVEALSLLQDVVQHPKIPAPGYPYIVHAYQEQRVDGVTWLMQEVRIWLTGVEISSSMWTAWPPDTPIPDRGPPPAMRWAGFTGIRDDIGTEYTVAEGSLGGPHQPAVVSSPRQTSMPRAVHMTQRVQPGPPPQAHELILHAAPEVAVAQPTTSPPPWPEPVAQLPETTYTLHLDHRMEWLRRNKKAEPRGYDGVRMRL